jgi:hypothetical protein
LLSHPLTHAGMDWAGFEPATSRLRSMHYYQPELPALNFINSILHLLLFPDIKYQLDHLSNWYVILFTALWSSC